MPLAALPALVLAIALAGCSGGADIGEDCDRHSDCDSTLQCVKRVCAARCQRAPDCGDGYACDERGLCILAHGQAGESCTSEVDCAPGLSCRLEVEAPTRMFRRCADQTTGALPGAECTADEDCHNGTCTLGHCIDLCRANRDCALGTSCRQIPHVEVLDASFGGCLPSSGLVTWRLPTPARDATVALPVPSGATHASVVLSTAVPRTVGAVRITAPRRLTPVFQLCPIDGDVSCGEADQRRQFYANPLRHRREVGLSVLALPSTSAVPLEPGIYGIRPMSFHTDGSKGPPPAMTAILRFGEALILDLHFHFLDLADHPCAAAFGGGKLDGASAQTEASFQLDFLAQLRSILKDEGTLRLDLGTITYQDIPALDPVRDGRPDLDGLEIGSAGALLELGKHARGINVFFVRNLSPVGIQALGPTPGPAGLAGTSRSGIAVGMDTLCYRSWPQLARLTAHEIARFMGLYPNVEIGGQLDGIDDSDDSKDNLMFYSELGGMKLSPQQREILRRSPVLR